MLTLDYDDALARVTALGALNGQIGVGERHDPDDVAAELNASFRAHERLITGRGFRFYVESTAVATQPAEDADFDWREIPWDPAYESVEGVDISLPGDTKRWEPLPFVHWDQRHAYSGLGNAYPMAYTVRDVSDAAGNDGAILLLPAGDGGRYVLHYLPVHGDITSGTNFRYMSGPCADWHVADTVLRLIGVRDGDSSSRVQNAEKMLARAAELIGSPATHAVPDSVVVEMRGRRGAWRRGAFVRR